ncbi:hypothetical protein XFUD_09210 [Xylella fastidiosa]|uniref:Phage-related protein n=2 Tax=Xylella fastidiosa TaxID=2371 RepID=A0ABC8ABX0_XYLFS|nr:hypothetical protein [Xylella fastidiosa]ALQ95289.1 hypothetical protein XFUD_09210 [Xylella fastidiosa]ALR05841.1 hypothetical protein XFHB_02090 [Xylella fastidiosa]AWG45196.1 hypothetical protein XFFB_02115 [Xylella fastidiosa]OCA57500.1 hypothetical protein AA93_09030 [Xylella fastidiosa subsp. pauca 11399]WGZ32794.1 hypothetical protein O4444_04085 [Xylella fastidiosa subsp. pauca]
MSLATDQVALLKDAYRKVLLGQSVRYGERQVTRADAKWISDELDKWLRRAAAEAAPSTSGPVRIAIADFRRDSGGDTP